MTKEESPSEPTDISIEETKDAKAAPVSVFERDFAKLVAFKEEHGHCNIPNTANYAPDRSFGHRIQEWRRRGDKNTLKAEQKEKLKELGFVFDPNDQQWQNKYDELSKCLMENNLDMTSPAKDLNKLIPKSLSLWISGQRHQFKKGILDDDRKAKLLSLEGFLVDSDDGWNVKFEALQNFCKEQDNEDNTSIMAKDLNRWVYKQRMLYKHDKMSEEHKEKLEGIQFSWSLAKTSSIVNKADGGESEVDKSNIAEDDEYSKKLGKASGKDAAKTKETEQVGDLDNKKGGDFKVADELEVEGKESMETEMPALDTEGKESENSEIADDNIVQKEKHDITQEEKDKVEDSHKKKDKKTKKKKKSTKHKKTFKKKVAEDDVKSTCKSHKKQKVA